MKTQLAPPTRDGLPLVVQGLAAQHDLWQIIRRRKGRILLSVVAALGLATAYCCFSGPWYDSNVQMLVIKKRLETTPISGPDQSRAQEEYLSTHMQLISSRKVVALALEKGHLADLPEFRQGVGLRRQVSQWVSRTLLSGSETSESEDEKLVTEIIDHLVVTRDAQKPGINPSNEILNLSYRGKVPADCPKVLDAIIDSYQEFLKQTYRNTNKETLELIEEANTIAQRDLAAKESAYQKFLADTPPLWRPQDGTTAHQDRLLKIDGKLAAVRMRRAEVEAAIDTIEKTIVSGGNPTAIIMRMLSVPTIGEFGGPTPVNQEPIIADRRSKFPLEEELVSLQLQKAKVGAIRGPRTPEAAAVDSQIDAVRRMMVAPGKVKAVGSGPDAEIDLGAIEVELLKQELDGLNISEKALTRLFEDERKGASASYIREIQDEAHRKGIERDRLLCESILNRLKETTSVKDYGGYDTQVIGPALGGELAARKYLAILGLAFFCGLLGGFAWAYLAEMSVRKVPALARSV